MKFHTTTWEAERWKARFFTIWAGQSLSLVGSRVAMFALIWWLTETTGSATVLASATLFALLPQIVLGPFAGVYIDRWNRRLIMIVADSAIAGASLWLAYLFWSGRIEIWHVYAISLAREIGGMFHWSAMQSSTGLMVPKEHLARVAGLNQAVMGVLNIVGPALGALLLSIVKIHQIMLVDVVTAAFAVGPLLFIAIPQPARITQAAAQPRTSLAADMREGLSYVLRWRGMLILLAMAMIFKVALTPAFSLLPLLVTDHFGGQAAQLATLESGFGLGVIMGGVLLGLWGGFKRNVRTTLVGVAGIGAMMLVLGLTPSGWFAVGVAAMMTMGVAISLTDAPLHAVMQGAIDPDVQGRVFALLGSLFNVTAPIGLAIAGPVTDLIGVQIWYVVAGVLCFVMGIAAQMMPDVMNLEDQARSAAKVVVHGDTGSDKSDAPASDGGNAPAPAAAADLTGR